MSGGSMNYFYIKIRDVADQIGDKEIEDLLNDLSDLLHDLEWWQSGDYSADQYYETLNEFKTKWFGDNRNERLKEYLNTVLNNTKSEIERLL